MRKLRAAVWVAVSMVALSANAGDRPIVIGEVSSQVARDGVDYAGWVRSASEEEVRGLDVSHVPHGKQVIVSVALVRMDTLAETRTTDTTCEISATLRDAKRGSVFAVLNGKARAKSGGAPRTVELSALQGALHGALARIPDVLRH